MRQRDGSIAYGYRQGDGNWFLVPREYWPDPPPGYTRDGQALPPESAPSTPAHGHETGHKTRSTVEVLAPYSSAHVRDFLRQIGRLGGLARARRHRRDELAAWGRVRHKKAAKEIVNDHRSSENEEVSS
jgi:hypothetical protein